MPGALEALDDVLAGVDGGGTTAAAAIERLLAAQIALRNSYLSPNTYCLPGGPEGR